MGDMTDRAAFSVAVVGAGIAGLATAHSVRTLARAAGADVHCTILESEPRWGGKLVTEIIDHEVGRFVIDGGPDSFLNQQKPWATSLALDLGLDHRLVGTNDAARKVYILDGGRPVQLPEGVFLLVPTRFWPFVTSRLISLPGKLRMGMDVVLPAHRGDVDETLADFVRRRLGGEALDKIAEPLLAGIYNAEAERQSMLATFPRFRDLEKAHGSLIRGMMSARRRRPRKQAAEEGCVSTALFVSFRDGTAELTDALARRLEGDLRLGARVDALERGDRDYRLAVTHVDDTVPETAGRAVVAADAVVLATPAFETARLVAAHAPKAVSDLASIRYVDTGVASLAFAARDVPHTFGFGVLMPRSQRRPINAVTFSSTKFDGRAPAGHVLLRVFFGGSRSPRSMALDDEELLSVVRREIKEALGITAKPLFTRIHRWWRANPQYDVGHLDRVARIEAALPPGLFVTGSPYLGVGIPDCVKQAADVAERVLAYAAATDRGSTRAGEAA